MQINIIDVNEPPVLTIDPDRVTLSESAASGTTVATFSAQDVDQGDSISWAMEITSAHGEHNPFHVVTSNSGGTAATLQVTNGLLLDYERVQSYTIRINISDDNSGNKPPENSVPRCTDCRHGR